MPPTLHAGALSLEALRHFLYRSLLLLLTLSLLAGRLGAQNTSADTVLEPGKPIERQLAGGQVHAYHLTLVGDQYLHVVVVQHGIDVVVSLSGPDNTQLAEVDSLNGTQGPESISYIAIKPGTYRLEIRPLNKPTAVGRYEARIEELRMASEADEPRIRAETLFGEATLLRTAGTTESLNKALGKYGEALSIFHDLNDTSREVLMLNFIGFSHHSLGEKPKALSAFTQAFTLAHAAGDRSSEGVALIGLGTAYGLGEPQKALESFSQALPIFHDLGDATNEAGALVSIGLFYLRLGDLQKARESYSPALLLARAAGERGSEVRSLSGLGYIYLRSGETQKALDSFNQALPLARELGDRVTEADALAGLGLLSNSSGNAQKALEYLSQALPLFHAAGDRASEAVALAGLGLVYLRLGDLQKARESYSPALILARAAGERSAEVRSLAGLGYIYLRSGETQKALDSFNQALPLAHELGDRVSEADALNGLGLLSNNSGDAQKALEYLSQALPLFHAAGDRAGEAVALAGLGLVYLRLGDLQKARESYSQALLQARAAGERGSEVRSLSGLGYVYLRSGETQKALDSFNQALPLARDLGDRVSEADALNGLGLLSNNSGDTQKALEYLSQALPLFHAAGDRAGEAAVFNSLGLVYGRLGDKQKVLDSFIQALPLARAAGDRQGAARALVGMGFMYVTLGELQKAFDQLNQALLIAREIGDRQVQGEALAGLGYAYDRNGEAEKGIESFSQSLQLLRVVGDRHSEALALVLLGFAYLDSGAALKAQASFTEGLALARAVGNSMIEAKALSGLSIVYAGLGLPQQALDSATQSLSLTRGTSNPAIDADTHNNLGLAYFLSYDMEKAADSFTQAAHFYRALSDHQAEASALSNLALAEHHQDKLIEARGHIEAAIAIFETLRTKIINQERRSSYFASAQDYYKFYIDLLMELHEEDPSAGHDGEALQASERSRARALLDILAEAKADIREGVDPQLVKRERALLPRLNDSAQAQMKLLSGPHTEEQANALAGEVEDLATAYEQVKTEIKQTSPRYAALTQPQPLTLKEIQGQLDTNTVLLEYSLGSTNGFLWNEDDHSHLWAVTSDSIKSYEIAERREIEAAARSVYDLLNARNKRINGETPAQRELRISQSDSEIPVAASALSRLVLTPVAAQLGKKRLVIVAEGMLQYIPFAMLPDPNAAAGLAAPPPLIAEHEIVSLPSASTLSVIRREVEGRKAAPKTIVALADPVFTKNDERVKRVLNRGTGNIKDEPTAAKTEMGRELELVEGAEGTDLASVDLGIPRLPGSRREAREIVAMVPAAERMLALDFDASRTVATSTELSQYRYVHFSTHGFLNSVHPELSGIVFSLVNDRGEAQDGFLRAHEVFNLKLPAELVVLSACQTGIGKEVKGEGLVSLTRGFMYAGAPRVVVSLWSVSEMGTTELMVRFYREMLKKGLRPAAALRAAQISLMKERRWSSPFYWAPFILQGEWR